MGFDYKLKITKIYVMYKHLKTPAEDYFENGNHHMYQKLFNKKHFYMDLRVRKLQEPVNNRNKIKEN